MFNLCKPVQQEINRPNQPNQRSTNHALDLEKVWNEEKMKDNKKLYEINFVIAHKIAINLWTP